MLSPGKNGVTVALTVQVIITEIGSGTSAVFLCNEWLSSDRGDGCISRELLPYTGERVSLQPQLLETRKQQIMLGMIQEML